MQCEAHRSIIRITQEQHFASSASRHIPHTIPPPLRCETYNRSGEVLSRVWNILFDWRKATLTVRYVNVYYDMFHITHLKCISFSITNRSSLVLSPEIFGVTIHYFVKRVIDWSSYYITAWTRDELGVEEKCVFLPVSILGPALTQPPL